MELTIGLAHTDLDPWRLAGRSHDPGHLEAGDLGNDPAVVIDGASSGLADDRRQFPRRRVQCGRRLDRIRNGGDEIDPTHCNHIDPQVRRITDPASQGARVFRLGNEVQMIDTGS